jgi:hypothetical protein
MKKTLTIQVEIPATQDGMYYARQSANKIINDLAKIERIGGKYDLNAVHMFTLDLRGAAGVYEFEMVVENPRITPDMEGQAMEVINSVLVAPYSIINIQ